MLAVQLGRQGSLDTGETVFIACFCYLQSAQFLFHSSWKREFGNGKPLPTPGIVEGECECLPQPTNRK